MMMEGKACMAKLCRGIAPGPQLYHGALTPCNIEAMVLCHINIPWSSQHGYSQKVKACLLDILILMSKWFMPWVLCTMWDSSFGVQE